MSARGCVLCKDALRARSYMRIISLKIKQLCSVLDIVRSFASRCTDSPIAMSHTGQKIAQSTGYYPGTGRAASLPNRFPRRLTTGMNQGARVLVISRDPMLLQTRELILGAFFQVNGAGRIQEAEELIATYAFDLIVLCYSLSLSDCGRVAELVQNLNPRPRILNLRATGSPPSGPGSDAELMIEAGPYGLLKKSAEILGVDIRANGQSAQARQFSAA